MNHLELIKNLQDRIDSVLERLIPSGSRVAFLEFPHHHNVGDSAIWLGAKAALKRRNAKIVYECDYLTYSKEQLKERIANGLILFNGGGSFGDIWYHSQRFRDEVVASFPETRIIQLPQSMHFQKEDNLLRTKSIWNSHKHITLLLRDRQSLELASRHFTCATDLCPDMAFAMGPLKPSEQPERKFVFLKRADREALHNFSSEQFNSFDWMDTLNTPIQNIYWFAVKQVRLRPRRLGPFAPNVAYFYKGFATDNLLRGVKLLSKGEIVLTDRLHAYILATLLGRKSIIMDNNYGKIKNFYDTWMSELTSSQWASSPREAIEMAQADCFVGAA